MSVSRTPNVVRGNRATLILELKADGQPFADLATAIAARFAAIDLDGSVVIDKTAIGTELLMDTPTQGHVSVPLSSTDTDIEEGRYDIAFQGDWGPGDQLEWNFPVPLVIMKGVIPV